MNRIISFFLAIIAFFTNLFSGVFNTKELFRNDYNIPADPVPYSRIDTAPKEDWAAKYIWDSSDCAEENVWMCMRKSVDISSVPSSLTAFISADSRYWLYINGENVVFEGSVKRGPTVDGSYLIRLKSLRTSETAGT